MSRISSATQVGNEPASLDGASVTLQGNVQRVFPSRSIDGAAIAEILIHGAEELFREIRICNRFTDVKGNHVILEAGSKVEITISVCTPKE